MILLAAGPPQALLLWLRSDNNVIIKVIRWYEGTISKYRIVRNKRPHTFLNPIVEMAKNNSKLVQEVSLLVMIYNHNSKFGS